VAVKAICANSQRAITTATVRIVPCQQEREIVADWFGVTLDEPNPSTGVRRTRPGRLSSNEI
jgi:hypothetical protein